MQTKPYSIASGYEAQLVAQARAGQTSPLIEYLYQTVLPGQAVKFARLFASGGVFLDAEDIWQAGIERVLRRFDYALQQASNPLHLLIHAAKYAMLDYCQEQRSLIRVPARSQQSGARVPRVVSLDAPFPGSTMSLLDVLEGGAA